MLFVAALVLLAACGGDEIVAPQFEPQVVNVPDDFSFQATGVNGVTQTLEYTWQNTGTLANVTQSSSITSPASSATLVLLGPNGSQVYSQSLTEVGMFTSRGRCA
jgi:hypothetical protein